MEKSSEKFHFQLCYFFFKTISCSESIIYLMPEVDQLFFVLSLPVDYLCIKWSKNVF